MFAIIETGGKQILVEEGKSIYVEKIDITEGSSYTFDKVVFVETSSAKVGTPYVKGAKVVCTVKKQGKQRKITIFKYKAKKASTRRKQGHRQPYTKLVVKEIIA